jgi:D-alanyl-D-alanine carboxypeptidase (penicillin-binding protein 5/6)
MNQKAEDMGLAATHFTNVVGLHNDAHYSTAADMAMILEYAVNNKTCRKILSAYEYKFPKTKQNPEGLTFTSTLFTRMYGDEMPNVKVLGGKTGYTDKAGNCIESFAKIKGKTYILVMCGGTTNWNMIYDTLSAYSVYAAGGDTYVSSSMRK